MKSRLIRFLKIIIVIILLILILYKIFWFIIIKYGGTDIQTRINNGIITGYTEINVDSELASALEFFNDWDDLFLTKNFKDKYKNRKSIVSDIDSYENLSGWFEDKITKNQIVVYANKKKKLLDFFNSDYDDISTEFYFDYKVDDNGWLDDVTLLRRVDVLSITGEPVEK